jgi:hypothetical protein
LDGCKYNNQSATTPYLVFKTPISGNQIFQDHKFQLSIMAVLLTGGTGKTSIRMARLLQDAKIPFLLASRKIESKTPSGMQATKFDWLDSSTFENPFQHKFPNGESISAIYLIAPETRDPVSPMNAFIDLAVQKHNIKTIRSLNRNLGNERRVPPWKGEATHG